MSRSEHSYVLELPLVVDGSGTVQTFLIGTDAWLTKSTDTPATTQVHPCLVDPGYYEEELFAEGRLFGAVRPSWGEIVIANDGRFDDWTDYGVANQPMVLRTGHVGDAYPSAWSEVWTSYPHGMVCDFETITIRQRSRLQQLDKPVVTAMFNGSGGLEGTGIAQVRKRMVFGYPGFVPLVPVDPSLGLYFVQANATDRMFLSPSFWPGGYVFDAGKRMGNGSVYEDEAEMFATAPAADFFQVWHGQASETTHGTGPIYLRYGNTPRGDLRIEPRGFLQNEVGGPIGLWRWSDLLDRAGLLDTTLATGSLNPSAGHRMVDDDSTYLDLMDDVSKAYFLCYGFNAADEFWCRELRDPEDAGDTSLYTFTTRNATGFKRTPPAEMEAPVWQVQVNAGQTWPCSLQEDTGDTTQAIREALQRQPWQTSFTGTADEVLDENRNAITYTVDILSHEFRDGHGRQAYVDGFIYRFGGRRECISLTATTDFDGARALQLLDKVTLEVADARGTARFRTTGGRDFRVARRRINAAARTVDLTLWGGTAGPASCTLGGGNNTPGSGGGSRRGGNANSFSQMGVDDIELTAWGTIAEPPATTDGMSVDDITLTAWGNIATASSNASLLVHGDSSVVDSSGYGHTITANGGASYSATQSKFGGGALYFDGTDDWFEVANHASFQFGGGAWSVDFWLYIPSSTTLASDNTIVSLWKTGSLGWWIGLNASGHIRLFQSADGTTGDFYSICTSTTTDTWMHIAVWRPSSSYSDVIGAVGGVIDGNRSALTLYASTAKLGIGAHGDSGSAFTKQVYVDELRICKGIVDYGTSNFTPPTSAYV